MDRTMIKNGCVKTKTGYRKVAVTSFGKTRAVLYAKRSGLIPDRGTIQTVGAGDFIITSRKHNENLTFQLDRVEADLSYRVLLEDVLDFDDVVDYMGIDIIDHGQISKFLHEITEGRMSSFLPAEVGWDGEYSVSDINKQNRIKEFFSVMDPVKVDKIVQDAMFSPRDGLYTDWNKAQPMPAFFSLSEASMSNISDEWVLFKKDGAVEFKKFNSTAKVSDDIVKAVHIVYNPYKRATENVPYGVKWNLYSRV